MPRPRHIDDDRLLAAAGAVLAERGQSGFTLERAAQRAAVSAATYIKRFGSKRALFVELNRRWLDSIDTELPAVAAVGDSPVARLRAAALWGIDDMDDAGATGRQLAALARDLQDDELRGQLASGFGRIRAVVETMVVQAVSAGELPNAPGSAQAAEMLTALVEGTKITWSVDPQGSLSARAQRDVDALLAGWSATESG